MNKELKRPVKQSWSNKLIQEYTNEVFEYIDQLEAKLQAVKDSLMSDEEIVKESSAYRKSTANNMAIESIAFALGLKYQRERTKKVSTKLNIK